MARRETAIVCPVCEFRLRGSPAEGYRCVRCHAQYGAGFVRTLRNRQFREHIDAHFGTGAQRTRRAETTTETVRFVVEDATGAIARAVETPARAPSQPASRSTVTHHDPVSSAHALESPPSSPDDYVDIGELVARTGIVTKVPLREDGRPERIVYDARHVPHGKRVRRRAVQGAARARARVATRGHAPAKRTGAHTRAKRKNSGAKKRTRTIIRAAASRTAPKNVRRSRPAVTRIKKRVKAARRTSARRASRKARAPRVRPLTRRRR